MTELGLERGIKEVGQPDKENAEKTMPGFIDVDRTTTIEELAGPNWQNDPDIRHAISIIKERLARHEVMMRPSSYAQRIPDDQIDTYLQDKIKSGKEKVAPIHMKRLLKYPCLPIIKDDFDSHPARRNWENELCQFATENSARAGSDVGKKLLDFFDNNKIGAGRSGDALLAIQLLPNSLSISAEERSLFLPIQERARTLHQVMIEKNESYSKMTLEQKMALAEEIEKLVDQFWKILVQIFKDPADQAKQDSEQLAAAA